MLNRFVACLMHPFKCNRKLATATALFLCWKCLELNLSQYKMLTCMRKFSNSFSFGSSLWWPLLLSMAPIKGHCQVSCIMSGFLHLCTSIHDDGT